MQLTGNRSEAFAQKFLCIFAGLMLSAKDDADWAAPAQTMTVLVESGQSGRLWEYLLGQAADGGTSDDFSYHKLSRCSKSTHKNLPTRHLCRKSHVIVVEATAGTGVIFLMLPFTSENFKETNSHSKKKQSQLMHHKPKLSLNQLLSTSTQNKHTSSWHCKQWHRECLQGTRSSDRFWMCERQRSTWAKLLSEI